MKNLTKSLLATLMLMGFGLTANASCGFDGNNKGGLSFSVCVQQEFLINGEKVFNDNLDYIEKVFKTNDLESGIKEIIRLDKIFIATLESNKKINKVKFDLKSLIMYIRTLSIQEILRKTSLHNAASL